MLDYFPHGVFGDQMQAIATAATVSVAPVAGPTFPFVMPDTRTNGRSPHRFP